MAGLQKNLNPMSEYISTVEVVKGRLYTVEIKFQSSVPVQPEQTRAVPSEYRHTDTYLQFLWLLRSPSRLLAHALPPLGSVNSEDSGNSKTIGIMNRITKTSSVLCFAIMRLELCKSHVNIISCFPLVFQ